MNFTICELHLPKPQVVEILFAPFILWEVLCYIYPGSTSPMLRIFPAYWAQEAGQFLCSPDLALVTVSLGWDFNKLLHTKNMSFLIWIQDTRAKFYSWHLPCMSFTWLNLSHGWCTLLPLPEDGKLPGKHRSTQLCLYPQNNALYIAGTLLF